MKRFLPLLMFTVTMVLAGCKALDVVSEVGTSVGVATGKISPQEAESIRKSSAAVGKAMDTITPEQEYFIGRSVSATILHQYKPYDPKATTAYLNTIGRALAMVSDKPETFGGYHFLILDTDEVNAFAAPGGFIFISRGLLRCCRTEDAVAAVLAHEIGHVQHAHGLQAIKKSRLTGAFTTLAAEGAKNLGGQQLADLTTAFEGTISDITATMVNSGYARKSETEADKAAIEIMTRLGYQPSALREMLEEMDKRMKPDAGGFAKTHPDPKVRIADIQTLLKAVPAGPPPAARQKRFKDAMAGI